MSEWISVKESLPEKEEGYNYSIPVIAYSEICNLFFLAAYIENKNIWFHYYESPPKKIEFVTHWRKLAEPPKEEDGY